MPPKKPRAIDVEGVACTVGASGIINVGVNPGWPAAIRYIVKVKPGADDETCREKVRSKWAEWAVVMAHATALTNNMEMNEAGGASATVPPADFSATVPPADLSRSAPLKRELASLGLATALHLLPRPLPP